MFVMAGTPKKSGFGKLRFGRAGSKGKVTLSQPKKRTARILEKKINCFLLETKEFADSLVNKPIGPRAGEAKRKISELKKKALKLEAEGAGTFRGFEAKKAWSAHAITPEMGEKKRMEMVLHEAIRQVEFAEFRVNHAEAKKKQKAV